MLKFITNPKFPNGFPMHTERRFLHDLASPLTTVILNLDNALALLTESPEQTAAAIDLLRRCAEQSQRAAELIQERRRHIAAQEEG